MSEIRAHFELLAGEITERHAAQRPEVFARYGRIGKLRCREDARFHLEYLDAALDSDAPSFFRDYVAWAKIMLAARNVPANDLAENLRITDAVLRDRLGAETARAASSIIRATLQQLPSMPNDVPSFIDESSDLGRLAREYLDHLRAGRRHDAASVVTRALDDGVEPRDIYRRIFEPVQQEIGRLWQLNELSVAQEHFCTAATQQVMTQLYTRLFRGGATRQTVVAMCAGGELHEIGMRIVADLLELEGWQTFYLGANVPPAAAVQMCVDRRADFLLISATVAPHIPAVAEAIRLFRARPEMANAKVIVGGRAFQGEPALWRRLGADGYAANADDALATLERLVAA